MRTRRKKIERARRPSIAEFRTELVTLVYSLSAVAVVRTMDSFNVVYAYHAAFRLFIFRQLGYELFGGVYDTAFILTSAIRIV